jgi:mRNA interferase RelE/StbE
MYQIIIKNEALKDLKVLPRNAIVAITEAIEKLATDPRPEGCKKLKGSKENIWRIRVGNYRVVYLVQDIVRVINVRRIGHRKDIYN